MVHNFPGSSPNPHAGRTYVPPDTAGTDRRAIRDALRSQAEQSEAHGRQIVAEAEASRLRYDKGHRVAVWTLVATVLTLLVALATLAATIALA